MSSNSVENIELTTSNIFRDIKVFMALKFDKDSIGAIYALGEVIQERLDKIEVTEAEKGGILTGLFQQLIENNKVELAIFREIKRALQERKEATLH